MAADKSGVTTSFDMNDDAFPEKFRETLKNYHGLVEADTKHRLFRFTGFRFLFIYPKFIDEMLVKTCMRNDTFSKYPNQFVHVFHFHGEKCNVTYVMVDINSNILSDTKNVERFNIEYSQPLIFKFNKSSSGDNSWDKIINILNSPGKISTFQDPKNFILDISSSSSRTMIGLTQPWQYSIAEMFSQIDSSKVDKCVILNICCMPFHKSLFEFSEWMCQNNPEDFFYLPNGIPSRKELDTKIKKSLDMGCNFKFIIIILNSDDVDPKKWPRKSLTIRDLGTSLLTHGNTVKAMLLLSLDALEYGNLQSIGFEIIDLKKQQGLLIDRSPESASESSITKQFFPTELSKPQVRLSRNEDLARRIVFYTSKYIFPPELN